VNCQNAWICHTHGTGIAQDSLFKVGNEILGGKMGSFRHLLFCICIVLSSVAFANQSLTKTEALRDVNTFLAEVRTHYGMAEYKEETFNVTFDALEKKYSDLVNKGLNLEGESALDAQGNWKLEEIQQLIIGLSAEFRDGHTNFKRNTSDGWTLGLKTADIEGRLVIVGVDPNFFVEKNLTQPIGVGDEVMEVNGKPVAELAKEIMRYAQTATYDSRYMWALEHILEVPAGFLRSKKNGEQVRVKFRKYSDGEEATGFFNWTNIKDFNRLRTGLVRFGAAPNPYYYGNMGTTESYFHSGLMNLDLGDGAIMDIGVLVNNNIKKEIYKNKIGKPGADDAGELKVINRLDIYSVAYQGVRIGVVRIPDYSPEGGFDDVLAELAYLRRAIPYLNQHTDMVIIDQVSNGGGYVAYVTELVKLFAHNQEIPSVTTNIRLTSSYLRAMAASDSDRATSIAKVMAGSNDHPDLPNFAELNISELLAKRLQAKLEGGEKWTGYLPYMSSIDNINEGDPGLIVSGGNPTYAGKVMILNDRRSASGGDFFPAIMQKSRALIFGTTSRGLGGPVYSSISALGAVQMFFRCAFGICKRASGRPFENVGVVPDVERDFTVRDLVRGAASYSIDALNAAVLYLAGKTPKEISSYIHRETLKPTGVSEPTKDIDDKAAEIIKVAETGTLDELVKSYEAFKLEYAKKSKDMLEGEEERIQIPIPSALFAKDLMLSSIHRRDAVLDRLKDMAALPVYVNDPDLSKLIKTVTDTIQATNPAVGVLTPCSLKLSNLRVRARKA
jgi:C-terminal processing protease CtpA/Prc